VSAVSGHHYYINFVDHYRKYVWLYPLINKSDAFSVFLEFKFHVNKFLRRSIKALQTDGGGEFIKFKPCLLRILLITYHVHTLVPKMVPQKESTATLSRPTSLF